MTHSETKKTPFEIHLGQEPSTKLSNLKTAVSVDSNDISVYSTRKWAREKTEHLVMSKKTTVEPKLRRGMTFSQTKKPTSSVIIFRPYFIWERKIFKSNGFFFTKFAKNYYCLRNMKKYIHRIQLT